MYLKDVIELLRDSLPKNSDKFSEKIAISTITYAAGIVTVVTVADHGLETGGYTSIVGAKQKTPITSIVTTDSVALVTTTIDHDQTLDYDSSSEQPKLVIAGVTVVLYNGSWRPVTIPSRRALTFEIVGAPGPAVDGYLLENSVDGFSGLKTITKINDTTFTFATDKPLAAEGLGGYIHHSVRIVGAISIDRVLTGYSKKAIDKWWAFIVPDDTTASKNRQTLNDSTYSPTKGDEYRQKINTPFNIYYIVPSKDDMSGRQSYDNVIAETVSLFKSILGYSIPSPYTITSFSKIILESHGPDTFFKSYYVHRFSFSITDEIIIDDINTVRDDVAFRDIDFDFYNDFDEKIMDNTLKTDEE